MAVIARGWHIAGLDSASGRRAEYGDSTANGSCHIENLLFFSD
jgi:hypothetical protein